MRVIDLRPEDETLYFVCLEDWSDEIREAGDHKERWYRRNKERGLRVKLALDDAGTIGGMIQYLPIEHSDARGSGLYFVYCIWVHRPRKGRGNFQKRGMGTALLEAAEADARALGAKGMAAWGLALPVFMRASWFRKHGYVPADRTGMMVLLWKRFTDDAEPPQWNHIKKKVPAPTPGRVTVSAFIDGWCPAQNMTIERARRAAAELGTPRRLRGVPHLGARRGRGVGHLGRPLRRRQGGERGSAALLQARAGDHCEAPAQGGAIARSRDSRRACARSAIGETVATMFLGIDIGTTKVAAVIVDRGGALLAAASEPHRADLPAPEGRSEQDAEAMLAAAWRLVRGLPAGLRARVAAVGASGQMHGFAFVDRSGRAASPLYTWQDQRCERTPGFLSALEQRTGYRLSTGFAPATMAWLLAHAAETASAAAAACTICDLAVQRLCGLPLPVTDTTHAASWGLFDRRRLAWDETAIAASGIPRRFFPEVLACGARAGSLAAGPARELGLAAGIPVAAGIGDNQASLAAALREPRAQLLLSLGTGGQLSAVLPAGAAVDFAECAGSFEYRPYLDGLYAAVAASLSAGSAWKWLADLAASWMRDLGRVPLVEAEIYARLNELGEQARETGAAGELAVYPSFLAERHDPSLRGRIEGIAAANMGLGPLAWALAQGIVRNLRDMMPAWTLQGRTALVGTGNALRRNPLLQAAARSVFGLPLLLPESREEAAVGAALVAGRLA